MYQANQSIRNGTVHCPYCDETNIKAMHLMDKVAYQIVSDITGKLLGWYAGKDKVTTPSTATMQCIACGAVFENPFERDDND